MARGVLGSLLELRLAPIAPRCPIPRDIVEA